MIYTNGMYHSFHCIHSQVKNIVRPSRYEQVVKEKEAAKQNIDLAMEERPRILTAAKTKVEEAKTEAKISIETVREFSICNFGKETSTNQ